MGATWTYAFFGVTRPFTEISFFGRPACHLANVLAPKVGCALKCAAWAGDPTPKQHPKASSGLWSMGLEMSNSVAIAAHDNFNKFIKNVQKICNRPINAPKNVYCNYMQPHACAGGHPNTLLKFSTFASESGSCASELGGHCGPHGLGACLALCVGPQWPELANTCLGLLPACVGTVPCTWLHTASLFWHADSFWRPLGHSLATTGILAVFCHLWAAGMPTQLLGAPQGWVALKIGCICHAPNQNGHPKPNGARHGMGAKTPFSFKKGVEILSLNVI